MLQEHQSCPLWARELKPVCRCRAESVALSCPLWARELKHRDADNEQWRRLSCPLWARELKLVLGLNVIKYLKVVPLVGA